MPVQRVPSSGDVLKLLDKRGFIARGDRILQLRKIFLILVDGLEYLLFVGQEYVFPYLRVACGDARCILETGAGVFIVDVYIGGSSGFSFIEAVKEKFPAVCEDTIIITGNASDEVVDQCIDAGVGHLLEKPVRAYALKLAVLAIVTKYLRFAKILLQDAAFAAQVAKLL